jgi:hypothetical protein
MGEGWLRTTNRQTSRTGAADVAAFGNVCHRGKPYMLCFGIHDRHHKDGGCRGMHALCMTLHACCCSSRLRMWSSSAPLACQTRVSVLPWGACMLLFNSTTSVIYVIMLLLHMRTSRKSEGLTMWGRPVWCCRSSADARWLGWLYLSCQQRTISV